MRTIVVNINKGEEFDQYCGRAGKGQDGYFGNPFRIKEGESRGSTIKQYKEYFYKRIETDPEFKVKILSLKGKRLGCFCKPYPCHVNVIVEYLEGSDQLSIF
jgi:hypothetical protein